MNLSTEIWTALNAAEQGQAPPTQEEMTKWQREVAELERKVDRLECDLQDAIEAKPTPEAKRLLDSIEAGYEGHANRLTDCLSVALSAAADRCGYSSPEYKAIDEILTYINNPA